MQAPSIREGPTYVAGQPTRNKEKIQRKGMEMEDGKKKREDSGIKQHKENYGKKW